MVGDSVQADIAGGKAAGLNTVLMSDDHMEYEDHGGADHVVSGFEELRANWFGV